jgi:transcriptional repressor NrdR
MRCPYCHNDDTRVIDSRLAAEGDAIRRRRECEKCSRRFTTHEHVEDILPMVIKKDGSRQTFDRRKVLSGIQRACEKRPVAFDVMNGLVDNIERSIQERGAKEIPASDIGEMVMRELKAIDDVAYVRFASVYRSFRDVNEFLDEIKGLIEK